THGSMLKLFVDMTSRYEKLSKTMFVFIILLFIMNILGKNIPNLMLSKLIGLHNFTKIIHQDMNLFKNNSNCMYTSCSSSLEDNFALVLNSTTLENAMRIRNVKNAYWDLSDNNTLNAAHVNINTTSCNFKIGFDFESSNQSVSSDNLGNITDGP